MNNLYLYVNKTECEKCLKYGIKLSEYADKILDENSSCKKGIISYLCPKDSDKFFNADYICLKINTNNLKIYIYNSVIENVEIEKKNISRELENYTLGDFEEPIALICTSILPENISLYNSIIDSPLLIDNSKEFYYKKFIENSVDSGDFTLQELYKALIILSENKGLLNKIIDTPNTKVYIDKKSQKLYTNINKF